MAQMLLEHDMGRKWLSLLTAVTEGGTGREASDWREIARLSLDYVRLLRDHIAKEDHCVFRIASQLLDAEETARLTEAFAALDDGWTRRHGSEGVARVEGILRESREFLGHLWTRS